MAICDIIYIYITLTIYTLTDPAKGNGALLGLSTTRPWCQPRLSSVPGGQGTTCPEPLRGTTATVTAQSSQSWTKGFCLGGSAKPLSPKAVNNILTLKGVFAGKAPRS